MMIYSTAQIRAWDAFTVQHEPIASADLMWRAASVFTRWFVQEYPDSTRPVVVLAGTGNNGGDGVVIARLLDMAQYAAKLVVCEVGGHHSADFVTQMAGIPPQSGLEVIKIESVDAFQQHIHHWTAGNPVWIDALFGTGLNRPLEGPWAALVRLLNQMQQEVVSVDIPSGLLADQHTTGDAVVAAKRTFSFQTPKRAFFYPENAPWVGEWTLGDIGLHPAFVQLNHSPLQFLRLEAARAMLPPRPKFAHKGMMGHALMIAGSYGKMGAALLATKACLRAGAGLVTLHAPKCGFLMVQTALPEAMYLPDRHARVWSEAPEISTFQAIGIGPGIGQAPETARAFGQLLVAATQPLVLDADALNLLSAHPEWLTILPKNSILTPHVREFERLFGKTTNDFARNDLQIAKAVELGVIIVLKGAHTAIAWPDGTCWFNETGNPGMATAGAGDVLTGILTGLLAQGLSPAVAACVGVALHGDAGDRAQESSRRRSLIAGDLVEHIGVGW